MTKDEKYQALLLSAQNDQNVVGFILGAGRGKGFSTQNSDYDIMMVVIERDAAEKYNKQWETGVLDIGIKTLEEFRQYAAWGSATAWDRYNYAYLRAQIDRTGEIQRLIDEKGTIPAVAVKDFVIDRLGRYINAFYRAVKNSRDGNNTAGQLDAIESVSPLLDIIFGFEGRLRPYNKYLFWELDKHSLKKFKISEKELRDFFAAVLQNDIEPQRAMFARIRDFAKANGYQSAIDDWQGTSGLDI